MSAGQVSATTIETTIETTIGTTIETTIEKGCVASYPDPQPTPFKMKWKKVSSTRSPAPEPRQGHKAVAIKELIFILGGGNNCFNEELHVLNTGRYFDLFIGTIFRGHCL